MRETPETYVIDTNVLVDYPDIIPGGGSPRPESPTIDLTNAHLVIPSVVIRELSSFKRERSDRGRAARTVLRRLRELVEGRGGSMDEIYRLKSPVKLETQKLLISILPVHNDFKKRLPFRPSENDMDGQIILAALSVAASEQGFPVDGSPWKREKGLADGKIVWENVENLGVPPYITILTNDNGLAIRAMERGIRTSRYGYEYPEPYTGRRDIISNDLFFEFKEQGWVRREDFEEILPNEPKLVANEFIIMHLEDEASQQSEISDGYFRNIGRYDREEDAIVPLKYATKFPGGIRTDGQAIYAEALMNPDIAAVICTGPAGSGKTYMASVYGYNACKDGNFIGVTVVPCENHSNIGALPGDLNEKMDPDVQPIKNALRNYLLNEDKSLRKELENLKKYGTNNKPKKGSSENEDGGQEKSIKEKLKNRVELIWDNWFSSIPIDNARGRDFSNEIAIYDEFQDQNISQADTLIKRLGLNGKIILTGDIDQIHAPYLDENNNGLVYASRTLYDDPMVAQVCFTEDEVVRHSLVKLIAQRQKALKQKPEDES